jgi:hypothetical protein
MIPLSAITARWQMSIIRQRKRLGVLGFVFLTIGLLIAGLAFFLMIVAEPIDQIVGGVNVDDFFDEPVCEESLFFGNQMFSWLLLYALCLLYFGVTGRTKSEVE